MTASLLHILSDLPVMLSTAKTVMNSVPKTFNFGIYIDVLLLSDVEFHELVGTALLIDEGFTKAIVMVSCHNLL